MSERILKINALIQLELGELLVREIEFPRQCLVTVTAVETSSDLHHAKVWVSVLPSMYAGKVLERLRKNAGHFQHLLNKRLRFKPLPRLSFAIDSSERDAAGVDQLLDQIRSTE